MVDLEAPSLPLPLPLSAGLRALLALGSFLTAEPMFNFVLSFFYAVFYAVSGLLFLHSLYPPADNRL